MSYRTHQNWTIILAILYMPISFFGFLMGMAQVGLIGETNPLIIASIYSLSCLGMFTPIAAYGGLILSQVLYKKGKLRASGFTLFLGLITMVSAFVLGFLLDWLAQFYC